MVLKQRADSDARQQLEDNLAQLQEREEHLKAALAKAQEVAKRVSTDLKAFQEELKDLKAQETAAKDQHRRNRSVKGQLSRDRSLRRQLTWASFLGWGGGMRRGAAWKWSGWRLS